MNWSFRTYKTFFLTILCLLFSLALLGQESATIVPDSTKNDSIINTSVKNDSANVSVKKNKTDSIDAKVHYLSADSMKMNMKEKKVFMYKQAEVYYKEVELKAGYIEMNFGENEVYASGIKDSLGNTVEKPVFKDGDEQFESDWIRYNFKTKKGIISNVTTEQSGGFLHGEKVKRLPDGNICLKNGYYTTCDHEHPHFYITLTKAKVIPDDKIVSGPAYLVVEDLILPLGIPFGFFPNKKGNTSGIIIPEYGDEDNRGFFLRNGGYYFAINDYLDLTLTGEIYSWGSWGLGGLTNYKKRYKFNGNFNYSYSKYIINDPESPNYQNTSTYWIRWNHQQDPKAHPEHQFNANVNMGSTTYNKLNSYTTNNRLRSDIQSNVSFSQRWSGSPFSMSVNATHNQNFVDSSVTVSLPELAFNASRIYPLKRKKAIGKPYFYEKIGFSLSSNFKNSITTKEDKLFTSETPKNFRNGVRHSIPVSTSFNLLKFFNFNPSVSYTERWYLNSIRKSWLPKTITPTDTNEAYMKTDTINGFVRNGDWMLTVPVTTKLYGYYMMSNPNSKIVAMRHMMTPSVSFSYRPDYGKEKYGYYNVQKDTLGNIETYSIYENGIFSKPPSGKYGTLNFNLGNNLELKVKQKNDTANTTKKITLIENLSMSTSYNMALDSLNWQAININGRTTLFKVLNLNFNSTYDYYALDSLKQKINQSYYSQQGKWLRHTNTTLSAGLSVNSDSFKKDKKETKENEAEKQSAMASGLQENYLNYYVDFKIPWNLSLNFNYSLVPITEEFLQDKRQYKFKPTQTLNFSGDVSLTAKWKVSFVSGYDIPTKKITYTSLNIHRDLHCWEMRVSVIPFGYYKYYEFSINVKSSVLQDLKYNLKKPPVYY